jgi:ferredoxin-NADP reductase
VSPPIRFRAVARQIVRHSPDVASYVLGYLGRRPRFHPGQFVHLALDEYDPSSHWPESRVFSIASAPNDETELRLTISRQGKFTARILDEVTEGRTLWLKGPYGEFVVRARGPLDRIVLVAGGTGVTPFCSLMQEALLSGKAPASEVWLFYGARSEQLLIYRELALRCAAQFPSFRLRCYCEQPAPSADIVTGRLALATIVEELGDLAEATFHLSGPKAMITSFKDGLHATYGAAPDRVLMDAWEA